MFLLFYIFRQHFQNQKMSKLKNIREQQNITQEELSDKSGISVRTIQRIEAGTEPKGHTLKVLAKALNINEKELLTTVLLKEKEETETDSINYATLKLINLSSLPFVIFPPLNVLIPLLLMFVLKQKNSITKQIISVQILWTILAPIFFMLIIFLKPGNKISLLTMIILVLSNVYIILRNTAQIDRKKELFYKLNFNII